MRDVAVSPGVHAQAVSAGDGAAIECQASVGAGRGSSRLGTAVGAEVAGADDGADMPHPVVDEGGSKRLGHFCAAVVLERQGDLQVLADCFRRRGVVRELLMAKGASTRTRVKVDVVAAAAAVAPTQNRTTVEQFNDWVRLGRHVEWAACAPRSPVGRLANVTPRSRGLGIVDIAAETLHDRLALVVEHAAVHGEDQCRV